jgi:hypothetical protein
MGHTAFQDISGHYASNVTYLGPIIVPDTQEDSFISVINVLRKG